MADGSVNIEISADGGQAQAELKKTAEAAKDLGAEAEQAGEQTEELGSASASAAGGVEKLGNSGMEAKLGMAALSAALAGVASSLQQAAQEAVSVAIEFESAFAKTQTIMDDSVVSVDDMREAILQLSEDTGQAATAVSEAVYQAISGSIDTADAINFVNEANMLAVAGFTSLSSAVDILTTAINAYGMEASAAAGIANVLVQTQNLGKTSVDELAGSLGKAIATASAFGVSLENVATAYVELTRNGIATAEATTYLSAMLNELGKAGSTVSEVLLEATGKSFAQLMADGYSLADVLQILSDSVNGSSEAMQNLWSSQEAGKAATAIMTQGLEDFNAVVAQMQQEMEGATGTTQAAYEIMTATSEFIDTRFHNALTNLGIAVGSQLTPALNAVKSALTTVVEGLISIVNSGPLAVSIFAAMSTAVTILAGAYAAYTAYTWLAETATKALTLAMDTNPVLLMISVLMALAAGVITFVSNLDSASNGVREFRNGLEQIDTALTNNLTSIQATSSVVDGYIDRLQELEAAGLNTAAAQQEYHAILELLVQTIPEMGEVIDLTTDTIKGGSEALRDYAAAWQEAATAAAYSDYMTSLYQKQAEAMLELADAQVRYKDAVKERDQIESEMTVRQSRMNQLYREAEAAAAAYTEKTKETATAEQFLTDEYKTHEAALEGLKQAYEAADGKVLGLEENVEAAQQKVEAANESVEHGKDVVEEATGALEDGGSAAEEFGSGWASAGDQIAAASKAVSSAVNSVSGDLEALKAAYDSAYDSAYNSISGQFNLWDKLEETASTSVQSITEAIQSQIEYWQNYNQNVATLMESGINGIQEFVAATDDGSQEVAAMYQGMVDALNGVEGATASDVQSMIDSWRELQNVHSETAESMARATTHFTEACERIRQSMMNTIDALDLSPEAAAAAKETINGYIDALEAGGGEAEATASQVAKAVLAALEGVDGSGAGSALGESFAAGIRSAAAAAAAAANYVASAAQSALGGGYYYQVRPEAYASGTSYAARGLAVVGEDGPELVYLRGGERILNAEETRSALSGMYPPRNLYEGTAGGSTGSFAGSAEMRATITVPVSIDGREIARATAEYMGEEMEFGVM